MRNPVNWAAFAALAIAVLCLLTNSHPAGVRSAAVMTARFSGLLFAIALAAHAPRLAWLHARRVGLTFAFVAAHGVHFATVLGLALADSESDFHNLKPATFLSFAVGFSMVGCLALTTRGLSRPARITHGILFYATWALFTLAFFSGRRALASAAMAAMMVVVMGARIGLALWHAPREQAAGA